MDVWNAALGSLWFWLVVVAALVVAVIMTVTAILDAVRARAESRAHSAAAYRQLHDRQEFRRIVEANRDSEADH